MPIDALTTTFKHLDIFNITLPETFKKAKLTEQVQKLIFFFIFQLAKSAEIKQIGSYIVTGLDI